MKIKLGSVKRRRECVEARFSCLFLSQPLRNPLLVLIRRLPRRVVDQVFGSARAGGAQGSVGGARVVDAAVGQRRRPDSTRVRKGEHAPIIEY